MARSADRRPIGNLQYQLFIYLDTETAHAGPRHEGIIAPSLISGLLLRNLPPFSWNTPRSQYFSTIAWWFATLA